MLTAIYCPCKKKYTNARCKRYLGAVDGKYRFKCDKCKGVIEGDTTAGWAKIIHPAEK